MSPPKLTTGFHQDSIPAEPSPQLHFATSTSPPSSPPLQHIPPIPLPQLDPPRTPSPIYTPNPAPAHFQTNTTISPALPSPRERLTRFAPLPPRDDQTPTPIRGPSLIRTAEPSQSLFPTTLPPRPTAPSHTSYFSFYALPRPHISARPSTPGRGGGVQMRSIDISGEGQGQTVGVRGGERDNDLRRAEEEIGMGMDGGRFERFERDRRYRRCLRPRHIGLVLGVVAIVVLFWILIGVGMGRKAGKGGKEAVGS